MADPRGAALLKPLIEQMQAHLAQQGDVVKEIPEWIMGLPLDVPFMFWGTHLDKAPEQIANELVAKLNG